MTEKWNHALGKVKTVGTIFMDVSKTFDTLKDTLKAFNNFKNKQQKSILSNVF